VSSNKTTLRVRIALRKRPELETLALQHNSNYRDFLVMALAEAVERGYQPKGIVPAKETRLEMKGPLKAKIRELARTHGAMSAEDYALAVIEDLLNGDFQVAEKRSRAGG
jgi:hypothetical protein